MFFFSADRNFNNRFNPNFNNRFESEVRTGVEIDSSQSYYPEYDSDGGIYDVQDEFSDISTVPPTRSSGKKDRKNKNRKGKKGKKDRKNKNKDKKNKKDKKRKEEKDNMDSMTGQGFDNSNGFDSNNDDMFGNRNSWNNYPEYPPPTTPYYTVTNMDQIENDNVDTRIPVWEMGGDNRNRNENDPRRPAPVPESEGDVGSQKEDGMEESAFMGKISQWTIYTVVGAVGGVVLLTGLIAVTLTICCKKEEEEQVYKSTPV